MSTIENERTKLLAGALNAASTSCFTVGIATPIAGYLYNIGNLRSTLDNWFSQSASCVGFRSRSVYLSVRDAS